MEVGILYDKGNSGNCDLPDCRKNGGKTDDDNYISYNFVDRRAVIPRDYTGIDAEGTDEFKIFIDLVPVRCDFADLRDISTGHSVLYTVDGCVF